MSLGDLFDLVPTLLMGIRSDDDVVEDPELTFDLPEQSGQRHDALAAELSVEEGEIVETSADSVPLQRSKSKARSRRERSKKLKIARQELERQQLQERDQHVAQVLSALLGEPSITIHRLSKNPAYLQKLMEIESKTGCPLSVDHPDFPTSMTLFISQPGLHLGLDDHENILIFAVRIESFQNMQPQRKVNVLDNLQTVMDWTLCVSDIKLNAAQAKPHGKDGSKLSVPPTRSGKMFGAGWHSSMEAQKTIVAYAPLQTDFALKEYHRCAPRMSSVAQLYRDGLCSIFPGGAKQIEEFAVENHIPSFASLSLDGDSAERPFANSLTITRDDFANYLHHDADKIQIAYGLWWAAVQTVTANGDKKYQIDPTRDHDNIKGGAFLFGDYAVAVDFEKASGLVEIYWRGKFDFHSTMASTSAPNTTRFGTSVQLMARGTAAVARYWKNGGKRSQVVTPMDRVTTGRGRSRQRGGQKRSRGAE